MQEENLKKKRLDNLDLMKAFAILAVLSLHVGMWNTDFINYHTIGNMIQYVCRLVAEGVPIFLMINGYLLLQKKQLDLKKHLKKIGKILAVFFVWAVILTLIGNALSPQPQKVTVTMLLEYVLGTRLFAEYTGVLWFLQYLIAVYIVYPALWKLYQNDFFIYQYIFIMVLIFSIGVAGLVLLRDILAVSVNISLLEMTIQFIGIFSPFGTVYNSFLIYLLYFMLGGMIVHYQEQIIEKRKLWIFIGMFSWLLEFLYGVLVSYLSGVSYSNSFPCGFGLISFWLVGVYALTFPYVNHGNWVQNFLSSIGKNTFGIYLSHYIFIFIYEKYVIVETFMNGVIKLIVVFICSYLFTVLVQKIPYVKNLITI